MKKIVFFLFATMLVASVKAQVYVGGTVGLWHNDDLDATFFKLEPEVGYNLSEKWAVGGVLAFAHGKADEGKYNAFALAPYAHPRCRPPQPAAGRPRPSARRPASASPPRR